MKRGLEPRLGRYRSLARVRSAFNPGAVRTNASLSLLKNLAGCAIVVYLLQAGHWLTVIAPNLEPQVLARTQAGFDQGMRIGVIATAFILAGKAVWDLWRLVRSAGWAAA